jgi:hypothetical protein
MLPPGLRRRCRLVGGAGALGAVLGGAGALLGPGADFPFAFGALLFGFGLLGWSGSILVGGAVEETQRLIGSGTNWTEADSRRAMARVGGVGAGAMVGVVAASMLLA